jgi:hypothetical protein
LCDFYGGGAPAFEKNFADMLTSPPDDIASPLAGVEQQGEGKALTTARRVFGLEGGDLDLARLCAAPLITYCAAKEMNHEHSQDG